MSRLLMSAAAVMASLACATRGAGSEASVFDYPIVFLKLGVSSEEQQRLAAQPDRYVPATLDCAGQHLARVGLRLREGCLDSMSETELAVTIETDHFDKEQSLAGLKVFHLTGARHDPSRLAQFCLAQLAAMAGVPAPRVGHALVALNERELGVHVLTEHPSAAFLDRHLGSHGGELLPAGGARIAECLDSNGAGAGAGRHLLERLAAAVLEPDLSARAQALSGLLDLEAFCRFMAFETVTCLAPSYSYGQSNGWKYVDAARGRVEFIPGPPRQVFLLPRFPVVNTMRTELAQAVMETPEGRLEYVAQLGRVVGAPSVEQDLLQVLQGRAEELRRHITAPADRQRFEFWAGLLQKNIGNRFSQARSQWEGWAALPASTLATRDLPAFQSRDPIVGGGAAGGHLTGGGPTNGLHRFRELMRAAHGSADVSPPRLYRLALEAAAGQLEKLTWQSTNWVPVTVRGPGILLSNVGVRLKGHATRRSFFDKSSFTLKFNWQVQGQALDGQTKLHLHSARFDPSYLNQFTGTWLFHQAGLPAPAVAFAQVTANGRDLGLFVATEGVTRNFLRRAFRDEQGLLFEGDFADVDGRLDLDGGRPPPNYDGLRRLAQAAQLSLAVCSLKPLRPFCDVDRLCAFVACEVALGHRDGYAQAVNNYRLYQHPQTGLFELLPHGMDVLALDAPPSLFPRLRGVLAQAVANPCHLSSRYLEKLGQVLSNALDLELFVPQAAAATRQLQTVLQAAAPLQAAAQMAAAEALVAALEQRRASFLEKLDTYLRYRKKGPAATSHPTPSSSIPHENKQSSANLGS